jgi:hypothetical protein
MIDYLASRLAALRSLGERRKMVSGAERGRRYGTQGAGSSVFTRANVSRQIPAYSIWNYNDLIRQNRLARLFSTPASALADERSMADLVEGAEIRQALAYRAGLR